VNDHDQSQISVVDQPDRMRYEVRVDGRTGGFVAYRRHGGSVDLYHTEIDDAFEGRGLGGALARGALDDLRARGLRVVASCPFIAGWIERHPDYHDLLDGTT
jgi:predicted GNAT family acetyltransferase